MMILSWLRWRCTRARIAREACRLIEAHGESAFLRAHERAWMAMGDGRRAEARFWRKVCREIVRDLRRKMLIASLFEKSATRAAAPLPSSRQMPPAQAPWPPPPVPSWIIARPLTLIETPPSHRGGSRR